MTLPHQHVYDEAMRCQLKAGKARTRKVTHHDNVLTCRLRAVERVAPKELELGERLVTISIALTAFSLH